MIQRDRNNVELPKTCKPGGNGDKEAIRAKNKFSEAWQAGTTDDFKFKYKRYSEDDIKEALHKLFDGKCAYCESRYARTQPMDVEHWRPKGEVHLEDGTVLPGYYWLAATWENLLPSCIDCNRSRRQHDAVLGQELNLGKANQFPIDNEHLTARHGQQPPHTLDPHSNGGDEEPLLLNPCIDEPSDHIGFDLEEAVVKPMPRGGGLSRMGRESIRVYALNRTELVLDRKETLRLIQQRIYCIDKLIDVLDVLTADLSDRERAVRDIVEELLSREIDALLAMQEPNREFSALARQLIDQYKRMNEFDLLG